MDQQLCQACGATAPDGTKFCPDCGVPSGPEYVALAAEGGPPVPTSPRFGLSRAIAPLAVAGLLGLGGLAVFGGSDATQPVVERAEPEPPTQSLAEATPTPQPTAAAAPTPAPDEEAIDLAPVDPAALPPTAATHLAVATGSSVYFLDLAQGIWTTIDTGRRLSILGGAIEGASTGLNAFGDGVLVQAEPNGRLLYVTPDDEPEAITTGTGARLMGVRDGLVFVEDATTFAPDVRIVAIGVDGEVAYDLALPQRAGAVGLTRSGQVVVQAGTRVYLAQREEFSVLARGLVLAVSDDSVLLYDCDEALSCMTQIIDAQTGAVTVVDIPAGSFEALPNGDFQLRFGLSGRQRYRLVEGELVEVDRTQAGPAESMGSAQDASGVWASVSVNAISFTANDGSALATIPFDVGPCCGGFGITFLTLRQ